jgi:phosphate acetyltransferase
MTISYPGFDELRAGQRLTGRITVTEAHLVLASGIFGDFAPLHVDEEFARQTAVGARVVPGALVVGVATGALGKNLGPNVERCLDQQVRFRDPVLPGDTVTTVWEVVEKRDDHVVRLDVVCTTQHGKVVLEGSATFVLAG